MLIFGSSTPCSSFDQAEFDRKRREHKQKMQDFDRKFKQNRSDFDKRFNSRQTNTNTSRQSGGYSSNRVSRAVTNAAPFDAKSAPAPNMCLHKFMSVVKSATSMTQVLPYYSADMKQQLEQRQARYNPSDEIRKKKLYKDKYNDWKGSPYESSFRHIKKIVGNVVKVNKTHIRGNTAFVQVNITGGGNWKTGRFELAGENNYWKFKSYKTYEIYAD